MSHESLSPPLPAWLDGLSLEEKLQLTRGAPLSEELKEKIAVLKAESTFPGYKPGTNGEIDHFLKTHPFPRTPPNTAQQELFEAEVLAWFDYHAPTSDQVTRITHIREGAKALAQIVITNCHPSAERTLALRALHLMTMHANSGIVLHPES